MKRRDFLQAILIAGIAPAFVRHEWLMKLPPKRIVLSRDIVSVLTGPPGPPYMAPLPNGTLYAGEQGLYLLNGDHWEQLSVSPGIVISKELSEAVRYSPGLSTRILS